MSDDLISRKAFMEYLGLEDTEENRKENVGEIVTLEDFDRQATAFDKEKVIEKLKRLEKDTFDYYNRYNNERAFGESSAFRLAIDIVEKGGIE